MTDRKQTYEHYLSVCESHKKETNKLIVTVLDNVVQTAPKLKFDFKF